MLALHSTFHSPTSLLSFCKRGNRPIELEWYTICERWQWHSQRLSVNFFQPRIAYSTNHIIISCTSEFFWKAKYNPFSLATNSSHWAYGSQACCLCCYAFVWASSGSQISPRVAILFVMCLTMAPSLRQLALWFILWILKHTFCCSAHRLRHGSLFLFWYLLLPSLSLAYLH